MDLKAEDIIVGHLYRGKRFRKTPSGSNNDRIVLHIQKWLFCRIDVQYDSHTVRDGKHYPTVSMEEFLKWAKEDITGQGKKEA